MEVEAVPRMPYFLATGGCPPYLELPKQLVRLNPCDKYRHLRALLSVSTHRKSLTLFSMLIALSGHATNRTIYRPASAAIYCPTIVNSRTSASLVWLCSVCVPATGLPCAQCQGGKNRQTSSFETIALSRFLLPPIGLCIT